MKLFGFELKRDRKKDIQIRTGTPDYTPVGGFYTSNFTNQVDSFVKKAYCGNTAVFAIINLIATKFASMPVQVFDVKDLKAFNELMLLVKSGNYSPKAVDRMKVLRSKALDLQQSDPISQLLNRPNPGQSIYELWKALMIDKEITGGCYLWAQPKSITDKTPIELHVLPAQQIQIIADENYLNKVLQYTITSLPQRKFNSDEVLRWVYYNPQFDAYARTQLYGLSPLRPLSSTIDENIEATKAGARMFANDGAKKLIFPKNPIQLLPEQVDEAQIKLNERINGNRNKGTVQLASTEMGAVDLSSTAQEMQLIEARQFSFMELCNGLGVPINCFGLGAGKSSGISNSSGTTTDAAMKQLIVDKTIPQWCEFSDKLNSFLLPKFNAVGKKWIGFDPTQLPEMQKDMLKIAQQLSLSDHITFNEKRAEMGYEPYPDEYMDKIIIPTGKTLLDDIEMQNNPGMSQDGQTLQDQPSDYQGA